ncbi:MAG: ATP-dependent 6-phosphofructokinase [bacterium]|nr:ATP-dependent 6-phosphofructokinase [bacterium]
MTKRIGILTGGGDVPGLNPCIRTAVERAIDENIEIVGIRRGWGGLLNLQMGNPESEAEYVLPLSKGLVRKIGRTGGTFLHTSRVNPASVRFSGLPVHLVSRFEADDSEKIDTTSVILENCEKLGLDALITIGGDDTLSFSERLSREGFKVVAIPKTMDNDVFGTDYCIGFSTALSRSVEMINNMRTSAGSHERILVVELFGRNSGETSLIAGWLADADRVIISESPFDPATLAEYLAKDKQDNPSSYAVVTISEGAMLKGGDVIEHGAPDAYGHRKLGGIGRHTADFIRAHTGEHIIYQQLAYLMRGGAPDTTDQMVGRNFGALAIQLLLAKEYGNMVCLKDGRYSKIPIKDTITGIKRVEVDKFYDVEQYRTRVLEALGLPMFLY